MNRIHARLISAYTTLVLAKRRTIEQVPEIKVTLEDESVSTIRKEVEIAVAEKEIEILGV